MLASVATLGLALLPGSTLNPRHVQRVQVRAAVVADIEAPKMESSVGFDFVPLLTALQSGQFREADQLTRDGLITIAGEQAQKRGFVYFSEVPKLPKEDLATIERLWNTYSEGKFGYSVQAKAFNSKKVDRKLSDLYDRIGWQREDGEGDDAKSKKLLRWLAPVRGRTLAKWQVLRSAARHVRRLLLFRPAHLRQLQGARLRPRPEGG